ncbi:hypothetical protein AS240_03840 [Enterococcus faecium]|nr:hypothetical protein [Enterococcus faecium]KWX92787.1 hypothetical protein AS221_05540 [Enterococcus faecium]KWY33303.1 hypothetical protein AS236_11255 [Enterococcus faecium]KWY37558.1 hypothetical protein AS237_07025 [Enterococcus faecium]KWY42854.1 hypothetical protein AS239_14020 [Enterococcus faecium]KWY50022.1 hypothetical protein AS241_06760 [Enterococcus faecium]
MTEKEQVTKIVKKYNKSIADLSENATAKEFKTVIKYVADQANEKQRKLVGLNKKGSLSNRTDRVR